MMMDECCLCAIVVFIMFVMLYIFTTSRHIPNVHSLYVHNSNKHSLSLLFVIVRLLWLLSLSLLISSLLLTIVLLYIIIVISLVISTVCLIIIIMKNFNKHSSIGHHGSKCRELAQHAHSRGPHAFTHTLTSTQLQSRCAKRQLSYYIIWNQIYILKVPDQYV